jgi:hypothetical protein
VLVRRPALFESLTGANVAADTTTCVYVYVYVYVVRLHVLTASVCGVPSLQALVAAP